MEPLTALPDDQENSVREDTSWVFYSHLRRFVTAKGDSPVRIALIAYGLVPNVARQGDTVERAPTR